MIYDLLVAIAIGMCAGLIMLIFLITLFESKIIDGAGHEHFMDFMQTSTIYPLILQIWVTIWVVVFFLWFWRNGGQTIGMRAWRLRLFSTNDKPFGYRRALLRLVCAFGGLGTLLVLFDRKSKLSLQDRLTNTEILVLSKEANHHASWKNIQE
ncbi:RDD family protein [Paraglaciecola sp. 2405UD69-4]|uniref:RDD family protein n=1 Tax=Paraglaciecola sp. 2405UD69-4 TaxID=3391836 RepID=UPI0039C9D8EE